MTNLLSHLMRPKALLLVLAMLALVSAGNARASMPVMPPAGSFEQAIVAADDPVEFLLLLTSGYCNNSGEDGENSSGPHCAFCVVTAAMPDEIRALPQQPRAPPLRVVSLDAQHQPVSRAVHIHGLRAPPLSA